MSGLRSITSSVRWLPVVAVIVALPILRLKLPMSVAPAATDDPALIAVRQAAAAVPLIAAPTLVGENRPLPPEASELLQPNATVSRSYRNFTSGRASSFVLVHSQDLSDMAGHYPPVCYPAHGWKALAEGARDVSVSVGDRTVPARVYGFERERPSGDVATILVANFFVLPGGLTTVEMSELRQRAGNRALAHGGVAQVQILSGGETPEEELIRTLETILGSAPALMDAIGLGAGESPVANEAAMLGGGHGEGGTRS